MPFTGDRDMQVFKPTYNRKILTSPECEEFVNCTVQYLIYDCRVDELKQKYSSLLEAKKHKDTLSPQESDAYQEYIAQKETLQKVFFQEAEIPSGMEKYANDLLINILALPYIPISYVDFGKLDYFIRKILFHVDDYWNTGQQKYLKDIAGAIQSYMDQYINKKIFGNLHIKVTDKETQEILSLTLPIVKHKTYWDKNDPIRTLLYKSQEYISLHHLFDEDVQKFQFLFERYIVVFLYNSMTKQ